MGHPSMEKWIDIKGQREYVKIFDCCRKNKPGKE